MTNERGCMHVQITHLLDESKCYATVRQERWPNGVECPHCQSLEIVKNGMDDNHPFRQRYLCKSCNRRFDDLTDTIFEGHHQPLKTWILCLYFMGLNLSNRQIAEELGLDESDIHQMTSLLRNGIVAKKPTVQLKGDVECDEAYIVAGHKGRSDKVKKKERKARRRRLKGARGRGTLEKEKPPIFGMIQRDGDVSITMLDNVQQVTIEPIIRDTIVEGTLVYTDEYNIYNPLESWGYLHKSVNHSIGEYARDEDGDGFHEVHVNTMEGFWSLLRSWLRPHRGISQDKLPKYLGFFEFIHNARKRGKALLTSLISTIL